MNRPFCLRLTFLIALLAISGAGCTRTHYRLQADRDVTGLVNEKSCDPRWGIPNFNLSVDHSSRYFDPTPADCPPMPQDDPASHEYMHCIAGMKHSKHWHDHGDANFLENPKWHEALGEYVDLTTNGKVKLSLNSAIQIGLINEQDYRTQLETLYLSALDVSTERFRLQTQFFLSNNTTFAHKGENRAPVGETNTLTTTTAGNLSRRFSTGAELIVGFANSFVWQFTGQDSNFTTTLLNFNLVQPLLRAGGKAVALEQLTIVERALLANLRAFERYRQGFYTNTAIGDGGTGALQRKGGFFGGTGLTGFTGQGASGFGGVGQATFGNNQQGANAGSAGAVGTGFAGGGAGTVGGFIGLLQQLQQVRNTQDNLNAETRTLGLLEANLNAGLIDIAQVDQFRQSIETERANLLAAQVNLQTAIDNFLVGTLGLPPDIEVELDDSFIRQFQFIDPALTKAQSQVEDYLTVLGVLPKQPSLHELQQAQHALHSLAQRLTERFETIQEDVKALQGSLETRMKQISAAEAADLKREAAALADGIHDLTEQLSHAENDAALLEADLPNLDAAHATDQMVALAKRISSIAQEASLVQARARLEAIGVEPVQLKPEQAIQMACRHRLDWMNNRAALVDTWRLITFNANALQSNVDITFSGDLGTEGNNPVKFQGTNGTLKAGLRFDAPFTRLLERNNYRSILISYQQNRRQLMQYQDQTYATLRRLLRQLDQLRQNLEIQRRAVVIAVRRVDQTREVLNQPPAMAQPGEPAAQLGPTSAQNLLTALSDLRNSQNNFMSVWLNYYSTRMLLYRELGVMEMDDHNLWVDRPLDQLAQQPGDDCELPPEVPRQWLHDAEMPEEVPAPQAQTVSHEEPIPAAHDVSVSTPAAIASRREETRPAATLPESPPVVRGIPQAEPRPAAVKRRGR